jgi:hypothetical protein
MIGASSAHNSAKNSAKFRNLKNSGILEIKRHPIASQRYKCMRASRSVCDMERERSVRSRPVCFTGPGVSSERRRRQPSAIEKGGGRVGLPCVADFRGVGYGRR